jgi:hypothetical protein
VNHMTPTTKGPMTRDDMIKLAREAIAGPHRPRYCTDPATFEPHEWVIGAMLAACKLGYEAAMLRAGAGLYPEGG